MKKKRRSASSRRTASVAATVEGLLCRGGLVFGHDPGTEGATVALLLEAGRLTLLGHHRNEALVWSPESSKVRRRCLEPASMAAFISSVRLQRPDLEAVAILERVSPRPGEGAVGAFGFGGWQHGPRIIFALAGLPIALPVPRVWQKATGVEALAKQSAEVDTKAAAVVIASKLFPALSEILRVKAAQGVADAALIAAYGAIIAGGASLDSMSRPS